MPTCECCGRESGTYEEMSDFQFEFLSNKKRKIVQNVKKAHPQCLESSEGQEWLAEAVEVIARMQTNLNEKRSRDPAPGPAKDIVDQGFVRRSRATFAERNTTEDHEPKPAEPTPEEPNPEEQKPEEPKQNIGSQ